MRTSKLTGALFSQTNMPAVSLWTVSQLGIDIIRQLIWAPSHSAPSCIAGSAGAVITPLIHWDAWKKITKYFCTFNL